MVLHPTDLPKTIVFRTVYKKPQITGFISVAVKGINFKPSRFSAYCAKISVAISVVI